MVADPPSDPRQVENVIENALDHLTRKYLTTIHSSRNRRARATDTMRGYSLRRDETPIIRAGIRVKIIEGERTTGPREDEARRVKRG